MSDRDDSPLVRHYREHLPLNARVMRTLGHPEPGPHQLIAMWAERARILSEREEQLALRKRGAAEITRPGMQMGW